MTDLLTINNVAIIVSSICFICFIAIIYCYFKDKSDYKKYVNSHEYIMDEINKKKRFDELTKESKRIEQENSPPIDNNSKILKAIDNLKYSLDNDWDNAGLGY